MKKLFAIFCSICLMPTFSAQAWIGGPFSNNSFFEPSGDDGVYEASATAINGIGIYRFAVGNEFQGVNPGAVTTSIPTPLGVVPPGGTLVNQPAINSGNVVIGAWGNGFTNVWFYEGVQYFGITLGSVNSVFGQVLGMATSRDNGGQGVNSLASSFKATLVKDNRFVAATPFQGFGLARLSSGTRFRFTVIGSKVSNNLLFGL